MTRPYLNIKMCFKKGRAGNHCMEFFDQALKPQVLVIRNIDYFLLPFDDKGRINKKEWEKGMRLGMDLFLPPSFNEEKSKQVINASHRFAKRRYEHEFKWKPTRKVEEAIVAAIFGKKPL